MFIPKLYAVSLMILLALVWQCGGQPDPGRLSLNYDGRSSSNQLVLGWEAVPDKQYNMLSTTALGQRAWQALNTQPLTSPKNLIRFTNGNDQAARFFKVSRIDTDAPEVWNLAPPDGA